MSHAGRRAGPQRAAGLFVTVRGGSLPARGRRLPLNPAARGGRRCPSAGACAAGVSLPGRAPAAAHGTSRRGRWPGRAGRGRLPQGPAGEAPMAALGRRRSAPAPPLPRQSSGPLATQRQPGSGGAFSSAGSPPLGPCGGAPSPLHPHPTPPRSPSRRERRLQNGSKGLHVVSQSGLGPLRLRAERGRCQRPGLGRQAGLLPLGEGFERGLRRWGGERGGARHPSCSHRCVRAAVGGSRRSRYA